MAGRRPSIDPYNLRLRAEPQQCVSGVHIPPGLVGHCHETPLCDEVLLEQAPALADALAFLQAVRRLGADGPPLLGQFGRFADRHLGPARPIAPDALGRLWRLDRSAPEDDAVGSELPSSGGVA